METYKINFANSTITITSAFAKNAAKTNSAEYKLLSKLQKDFPNFSIVQRTHKTPAKYTNRNGEESIRNPYKNLTFENMERFISAIPNNKELLKEYNFLKETASALQLNTYAIVRKWFSTQFPKYKSNPLFYLDTQIKLVKGMDVLKEEAELRNA